MISANSEYAKQKLRFFIYSNRSLQAITLASQNWISFRIPFSRFREPVAMNYSDFIAFAGALRN